MMRNRSVFVSLAVLALGTMGIAVAQEIVVRDSQQAETDGRIIVTQRVVRESQPVQSGPHAHYKNLLRTIEAPADQTTYGDFCDYGYWNGTTYGGHDDLQPGYWVYLAPNWYIFKEAGADVAPLGQSPRAWGPEQATGAPNTWPSAGDLQTAWASKTSDGQREWLELTYDAPIRPSAVLIYETFNPGAVERITGYNADGKEFDLWTGVDPTAVGSEKGISVIPLHPEFDLTRIRIYLDSQRVAGWNEIDAVGLLDAAGTTHWATSATASSSYADFDQLPQLEELELSVGELGKVR